MKKFIDKPIMYIALFFSFLYVWFLKFYDTSLYHHYHQPVFYFDKTFFKEYLSYPGGLGEWCNQFVMQFLFNNWLGSLIFAALFSGIFLLLSYIIKKLTDNKISLLFSAVPVILLVILQNNYNTAIIIPVRYLLVILLFLIYERTNGIVKIGMIFLSFLIYYFIGGWAFSFYSLVIISYDLLYSSDLKKYYYIGFNLLAYLIYPFIAGQFLFPLTMTESYFYIAPYVKYYEPYLFRPSTVFYSAYFSFIFLLIVTKLLSIKLKPREQLKILFHPAIQMILIIIISVLTLKFNIDSDKKTFIKIDQLANQKQWQSLLKESQNIKSYDRISNFHVNRALFHTKQMMSKLFSFYQVIGTDGLFINRILSSHVTLAASDLYLELNYVNASLAMAYEGQTKYRYDPRFLKRLALLNVINENYVSAEKFILLLKKNILHKEWAVEFEKYLKDPSITVENEYISKKREHRFKYNFFIDYHHPNVDLKLLLRNNGNNMMAFEYLLATYMLDCKIGNLKKELVRFKKPFKGIIPRHIEEALLFVNVAYAKEGGINLNDYNISQKTYNKFKGFNETYYRFKNDPASQKQYLTRKYGDTFWYYVRYVNPMKTQVKLQKSRTDEKIL